MRFTPRRLLATLVALAALLTTACDPPPPRAEPVPGRVALTGNSILLQAYSFGGDLRGADVDGKVGLGWGPAEPLPRVRQDVADPARSPEVLVVAGSAALGAGYGPAEQRALLALVLAPHPAACVVLVVPHRPLTQPGWHAQLARVEADLEYLAANRPRTVLVDWGEVASAHPEYLAPDGVHLAAWVDSAPAPAARAYLDLVWSGVERC